MIQRPAIEDFNAMGIAWYERGEGGGGSGEEGKRIRDDNAQRTTHHRAHLPIVAPEHFCDFEFINCRHASVLLP